MNQYHLFEVLGHGKDSTIYKGRKKQTICYYAIKRVPKDAKARVLQEVRAMTALHHDNVLRFHSWCETRNHLWLVLEYCVGGDLYTLLKEEPVLSEDSIHGFAHDIALALQHVHANGLVYCDLKPSNILLDEKGSLKLGGFGLSQKIANVKPFTLQQAKRASPAYMAPELFQNGPQSTASDLWALGCVMYECAAGKPPFAAGSLTQLVHDIMTADPVPIAEVSAAFEDLIACLLDKNPATRISWEELPHHPFWGSPLPEAGIPEQPLLDAFINENGLAPSTQDTESQQGKDHHLQSVSASSTGDLLRMSQAARSNLEADERMSEVLEASAAPAENGDIRLNSHAELNFQSSSPSAGAGSATAPAQSNDIKGHAIQDGGMTPALPQSNPRPPAYSAAGVLWQPDFGLQEASSSGQPTRNVPAGGLGEDAVQSIVWHASDRRPAPIVANATIERLGLAQWDASALPFAALGVQDFEDMSEDEAISFFDGVFDSLRGTGSAKLKVNVLNYLQSIISCQATANPIMDSPITALIVQMLRAPQQGAFQVLLATILGLLVRHCTFIPAELADCGVLSILTEALGTEDVRLKRRCMACLGELLFYIAAMPAGAAAASCWDVEDNTLSAIISLLEPSEDTTVQHYAVKTLENLYTKNDLWRDSLAQPSTADALLEVWRLTQLEPLRVCAASALSRLLRAHPALAGPVTSRPGFIRQIAADVSASAQSSAKVPAVNLLNLVLQQPGASSSIQALQQDQLQQLLQSLISLLEQADLVAAKALVALGCLCKADHSLLGAVINPQLLQQVARIEAAENQVILIGLTALRQSIRKAMEAITNQVRNHLVSRKAQDPIGSAIECFPAVLQALTARQLQLPALAESFVVDLADAVTAVTGPHASADTGLTEIKEWLLGVLEAVVQQQEVDHLHRVLLERLLPALLSAVASSKADADMRFSCLKVMSDLLALLLDLSADGGWEDGLTEALTQLVAQELLPMVPELLREEKPIPVWALKVVEECLESLPDTTIPALERLGMIRCFFEYLALESEHNNVRNMRICHLLLEHRAVSPAQLNQAGAYSHVADVLQYAADKAIESFLPVVLELLASLLEADRKALSSKQPGAGGTEELAGSTAMLIQLANTSAPAIASVAAACANLLLDMWCK